MSSAGLAMGFVACVLTLWYGPRLYNHDSGHAWLLIGGLVALYGLPVSAVSFRLNDGKMGEQVKAILGMAANCLGLFGLLVFLIDHLAH